VQNTYQTVAKAGEQKQKADVHKQTGPVKPALDVSDDVERLKARGAWQLSRYA